MAFPQFEHPRRDRRATSPNVTDMIIDSGWDLLELAKDRMWRDDGTSPLVVIVTTGDLEFYGTTVVDEHFSGVLDDYHDAIIGAADEDFVRYFAVAHESSPLGPESLDHDTCERLRVAAARIGLCLISELYVGRDGRCSTGPMHTFKYYTGDDRPKLIARRPRQFAKTRLAGGPRAAAYA